MVRAKNRDKGRATRNLACLFLGGYSGFLPILSDGNGRYERVLTGAGHGIINRSKAIGYECVCYICIRVYVRPTKAKVFEWLCVGSGPACAPRDMEVLC